ncbi:MAG TPA: peptidylprolyl isomerase [Candidatus Angelobacter sp.]|nr:peptidylprolyl isomerase [Candidatus Angelobacter sp.]
MFRNLLTIFALAAVPAFLQAQAVAPNTQAAAPVQTPHSPAVLPPQAVQPVAPDAPVITIHGICQKGQPVTLEKSDSCSLALTRAQFESMVSSMNMTNQPYTPPALRGFATDYATLLALAEAGENEGVDKDPRFQELMQMARTRALAESYRRHLQEKFGNPPQEEIEHYYQQNLTKFEQVRIERIQIPKVNPKRPQEKRPEFEKKARQLATELRERAAHGEDMTSLQVEAYVSLGLAMQPPQTALPINPRPTFPANIEQDIQALKPGEITKVEFEPSGFNIYKLRGRNTLTLDQAKPQIVREISQQKVDAALKSATSRVHPDLNEQYFNPRATGVQPPRQPARMLPPSAMQSNHPNTTAAPAGTTVPAAIPPGPPK